MTQHPEEGTLHAYIDGELSPAEAATLELHVGECARCAAALAEARGYAAAASRVITALDAAPSSAVTVGAPVVRTPSAPARRAARPQIFRLPYARAAALLLVVGGTVLVADRTGSLARRGSPAESSMMDAASGSDLAPTATAGAATATAADLSTGSGGGISDNVTREAVVTPTASARRATDGARRTRSAERSVPSEPAPALVEQRGIAGGTTTRDAALAAAQTAALGGKEAAPMAAKAPVPPAAPPPPPASAAMRLEEVVVTSALSAGPTVSRYRTRDGKILTLTEEPLRTSFAAESALAVRRATRSMAQSAAAPMLAPAVNSFRWSNVERGRTYTLSGPMTVAELEAAARRLSELERLP